MSLSFGNICILFINISDSNRNVSNSNKDVSKSIENKFWSDYVVPDMDAFNKVLKLRMEVGFQKLSPWISYILFDLPGLVAAGRRRLTAENLYYFRLCRLSWALLLVASDIRVGITRENPLWHPVPGLSLHCLSSLGPVVMAKKVRLIISWNQLEIRSMIIYIASCSLLAL